VLNASLATADNVRQVTNTDAILIVFIIIFGCIWELVKTVGAGVVSIIYMLYQALRITQKNNPANHVIA
jgi:hypothetical protein